MVDTSLKIFISTNRQLNTLLYIGLDNVNHDTVLMVNVPPNSPATGNSSLRNAIIAVLNLAYAMPTANRPKSIAFDLIGSRAPLDYGYDNSAEQILAAITWWFNISPNAANKRARFSGGIFLLVPYQRQRHEAEMIERAWIQAWE